MTNPNDPAFPVISGEHLSGLTKREYFAACAMQGLLAAPRTCEVNDDLVEVALSCANALIFKLNQHQE